MNLQNALVALIGPVVLGGALHLSSATPEPAAPAPELEPGTIHVIEHAGYFETRGDAYGRQAGPTTFVVENRSGRDAGFVLAPAEGEPHVIGIADGETGRLEVDLEAGSYTYFCPIIPTPPYPLTVQ